MKCYRLFETHPILGREVGEESTWSGGREKHEKLTKRRTMGLVSELELREISH